MNKFNKFVRRYWLPILALGIILIVVSNTPHVFADSTSDLFKNHPGVTKQNMDQAQKIGSPVYVILGNLAGFIAVLVVAWQGVQTAIDLAYYYIPFTRTLLNPGANQAQPQQGGMGGSMGMSGGMGGMGGGMGMSGGMGGGGVAPQPAQRNFLIVSDDMLKAMELNGSNQAQQGAGAGPMMGGGMGMGMQNQAAGAAPANKRSVVASYFVSRVVSTVFLGVCIAALLTSSIFLDSGLNLGSLVVKGMSFFNGNVEKYNQTIVLFKALMLQ